MFFATTGLSGAFTLVFMAALLGVSGPRDRMGLLWEGPMSPSVPKYPEPIAFDKPVEQAMHLRSLPHPNGTEAI